MKKDKWQLIKGELGFSLPEIMVGSAILAGVALAGATIFRNQARSQARIENDQILNSYHAALAKHLANDHNCNATFKFKYGAASVGGADDITAIDTCDVSGSTCNANFNASNVNLAAFRFIREGEYIDRLVNKAQLWRLTSITYGNTLDKSGALKLRFLYTINPRVENRTVTKDVVVNLRFNQDGTGGKQTGFIECFSDQESAVNNLQKDVCKSMFNNFTNVSSDGGLVVWNEQTQTCELNGTPGAPLKNCSTAGLMVAGIRSDGTVHCRSMSDGFNPTPVTDTAACAATSKVKLDWVGSKVKATCVP